VRLGQWIGFLTILVCLYIIWQIRQVLLVVFLAVVLATGFSRIERKLYQMGLKRWLAVSLTVMLALGMIVGFFFIIVPPFIQESVQLVELVPQGLQRFRLWVQELVKQLPGGEVGDVELLDQLNTQLQPYVGRFFANFLSLFSNTLTVVLNLLLVVILTIMFLLNPHPYRQGFVRLFPAFYRRRVDGILTQCEQVLVGWLTGTLFNMVVIGLVSGLVLMLLDVRLVFANALLAGLLEAIPNIGPILSVVPPMAIALLDDPVKPVVVLAAYFAIQQLEQYLLVPFVMAKQVDLLPGVTLLSQVIFTIFFGFLGLLLALPLVLVGQVWLREVLIKDVFDKWQSPEELETVPARVGHTRTEPENPRLKQRVIQEPVTLAPQASAKPEPKADPTPSPQTEDNPPHSSDLED
jgi:predicted PurR-regulated permease PerM